MDINYCCISLLRRRCRWKNIENAKQCKRRDKHHNTPKSKIIICFLKQKNVKNRKKNKLCAEMSWSPTIVDKPCLFVCLFFQS